jgi:hypothetical protein
MSKKLVFVFAVLCCLFLATSLSAQATRTWVSGVGDDVNPCSRTAPCKTFAGAISKTQACGEISVLDPGGFGAVTVTKSITINGTGTLAGILNTNVNGVLVVLQGAGDACNTVIIRNISINGGLALGTSGVRDASTIAHNLHIEHVDISHQQRGVDIAPTVANSRIFMTDVDIRHTTVHGIDVRPTAGQLVKLNFHDVRSRQSAGDGLHLLNNAQGEVNASQFEGNNNGVNVVANSVTMMLIDTVMSNNNGTGLINGSTANTLIDGCTFNSNNVGILNNTGGNVFGYFNNALGLNNTDVSGTAVTTLGHP